MSEFAVGVISSIVASIITYLYFELRYRILIDNGIVALLGVNPRAILRICYANIQSSESYQSPVARLLPSRSFDYGDADSIILVYDKFRIGFRESVRWARNAVPRQSQNGNMVSIAGPKWNKLTEQLIGEIGSPLYYSDDVPGLIERRANHTNPNVHQFQIREVGDCIEIEDFGCLIFARTGVLGGQIDCALVVSGYTTFGTLSAAEALHMLKRSEVRKIAKAVTGDKRFAIVVRGKILLDHEGKILSRAKVEVVTWIGERDFLQPYEFRYHTQDGTANSANARANVAQPIIPPDAAR